MIFLSLFKQECSPNRTRGEGLGGWRGVGGGGAANRTGLKQRPRSERNRFPSVMYDLKPLYSKARVPLQSCQGDLVVSYGNKGHWCICPATSEQRSSHRPLRFTGDKAESSVSATFWALTYRRLERASTRWWSSVAFQLQYSRPYLWVSF